MSKSHNTELVIISGVSGSGKSTALNAYEDIGYFCVDNLPAALVDSFVRFLVNEANSKAPTDDGDSPIIHQLKNKYALLAHCRNAESVEIIRKAIYDLRDAGVSVTLLFLECQDEVVATRFRQTRRPHPLLQDSTIIKTIAQALDKERELLSGLRVLADRTVDTSSCSPHELRKVIEDFGKHTRSLSLNLLSFGFKYGVPHDMDLLVDVRFLPNPYFVESLRDLRGVDSAVSDYVLSTPEANEFLKKYMELLEFLIPKYEEEGKRYLTLAIGCTGGKHRSVALAERFAQLLGEQDIDVSLSHRDIQK